MGSDSHVMKLMITTLILWNLNESSFFSGGALKDAYNQFFNFITITPLFRPLVCDARLMDVSSLQSVYLLLDCSHHYPQFQCSLSPSYHEDGKFYFFFLYRMTGLAFSIKIFLHYSSPAEPTFSSVFIGLIILGHLFYVQQLQLYCYFTLLCACSFFSHQIQCPEHWSCFEV